MVIVSIDLRPTPAMPNNYSSPYSDEADEMTARIQSVPQQLVAAADGWQ